MYVMNVCVNELVFRDSSKWSTDGCELIQWNLSYTTCRCIHMTSFAVLMQVGPIKVVHYLKANHYFNK